VIHPSVTAKVKRLIERLFKRDDWTPATQGWQAGEDELRLSGRSKARREALASHPLLPAGVGRATSSGNQTMLYLTPMHAQSGLIKSMVANVQAAIQHVKAAAEQLPKLDRWATLRACICRRIVGQIALPVPPPTLAARG
jgi:hypothetical protein